MATSPRRLANIVLDTNVLIAGLRSRQGASFRLVSMIGKGRFNLHLSVPLVLEYEDVLSRQLPNLSGLDANDIERF